MRKTTEITIVIMIVLLAGIAFSQVSFAGSTATFSAHCYMPEMVSSSTIEQVDTQNKEVILEDSQEKGSFASKRNPNIIQKTEEIISKETNEPQIIVTVCAK